MFLTFHSSLPSFLLDSWSIPFAFSCTCLSLQIIDIFVHCISTLQNPRAVVETEIFSTDKIAITLSRSITNKVKKYGGWTIYLFMVARLFGCLVLFASSIYSFLGCKRNHHPGVVDTASKHLIVRCPDGLNTITFVNLLLSLPSLSISEVVNNSSSTALQWP